MALSESEKRIKYMLFIRWHLENNPHLYASTGFKTLGRLLSSPKNFEKLIANESSQKTVCNALNFESAPSNNTIGIIEQIFQPPISYDHFFFSNNRNDINKNPYYRNFLKDNPSFKIEELSERKIKKKKEENIIKEKTSFMQSGRIVLQGTEIIDETFKSKVLSSNKDFNSIDFYSAKQTGWCQWCGILKKLDVPRKNHDNIKNHIIKSFNKSGKISAVIYGAGGSGKSTLLKRLAIDCISNDFIILWINDFEIFVRESLDIIKNDITEKYLLIIEDWYALEKNGSLINTFLYKISKTENIRIAIEDLDIIGKEYGHYLRRNNVFKLSSDENADIIKKILTSNPSWEKILSKIMVSSEPHKASLYLILFVIVWLYSKEHKQVDIDSSVSKFRSIIINDVKKINSSYKGLAKALYYVSCLHKRYKTRITFEAFLKIADYYERGNVLSQRLLPFDSENQISEILSNYISIKHFTLPKLSRKHTFMFHYDLLGEEGLSKLNLDEWPPFDNSIQLEILNILIEKNEKELARLLYTSIAVKNRAVFKNNSQIKEYHFKLVDKDKSAKHHFTTLLFCNSCLEGFYINAQSYKNDKYWKEVLKFIFKESYCFPHTHDLLIVLKTIIEKGCTSPHILKAYNELSELGHLPLDIYTAL